MEELMGLEPVDIILAVIVILIFMAIFTLLRTINSPFIYRFASIFGKNVEDLDVPEGSHRIVADISGRKIEFLALKHSRLQGKKGSSTPYFFLRVEVRSQHTIRFKDVLSAKQFTFMIDEIYGAANDLSYLKPVKKVNASLMQELSLLTDDESVAHRFMSMDRVQQWLSIFREDLGMRGMVMPVVIDKGWITLDYSLTQRFSTDMVDNPRNVRRHADRLIELAEAFDEAAQVNVA